MCVALLNELDDAFAEEWRNVIVKEQVLSLVINTPPYIQNFSVEADVRHIQPGRGGAVQFGLRFLNLREDQKQSLQNSILTFAMKKVKGAFRPGEDPSRRTTPRPSCAPTRGECGRPRASRRQPRRGPA